MEKKTFYYLDPKNRIFPPLTTESEEPILSGTYLAINGRLIDTFELDDYCPVCFSLLRYSDDFDALYCAMCNEWREESCDDPECDACRHRPDKPLK